VGKPHISLALNCMAEFVMFDKGIDRLAMRGRPKGDPVMHQNWENTLFLHWPVAPSVLRPLIPSALDLDTFDDKAWLSITPFHIDDVHPPKFPAFPGLSSFHELNVRTYVTHQGIPGIWFFSLDASKLIPTVAARIFFMIPYFKATIRFLQTTENFAFSLSRSIPSKAEFKASWKVGTRLRDPDADSLAFFLVERYCAFAAEGNTIYQIRIYHHPWILDEAQVELRSSSMISSLGLPEPASEPLAHFSRSVEAEIWAPTPVGISTHPGLRIHVE
jgi:uncharacterized protein YqjF (DUF2071 family)